jgi:hypothetical protein
MVFVDVPTNNGAPDDEVILPEETDDDDAFLLDALFAEEDGFDDLVQAALCIIQQSCDSSDDEPPPKRKWGGSKGGKAKNKNRNFDRAHEILVEQYFSGEESTYDDEDFRRRFVVERHIFDVIHEALKDFPEFRRKKLRGYGGKLGVTTLCKITACMRVIAYGECSDRNDDKLEISESYVCVLVKSFKSGRSIVPRRRSIVVAVRVPEHPSGQ